MYLPSLTDRELAHHADVTFDALTATDLQVELAKRFTALLDRLEPFDALADKLHEAGIDVEHNTGADRLVRFAEIASEFESWDIKALLDVLSAHDLDSPDELKKLLQRDAQLRDVLDSLAQPLADLQALATPA